MKRQLFVASAATVLLATTACADLIYYAISDENSRKHWQSADQKEFESNRPCNVFDFYTVRRSTDGTVTVHRQLSGRWGDWSLLLIYYYGKNGLLRRIDFDFHTVHGECTCGESGPVRVERSYSIGSAGNLRKEFERITEMKTGRLVDWTFHEPEVRHWASLRELPIVPR